MTQFIDGLNGQLAYDYFEGSSPLPPIIFLCGFKSDMMGSKAEWLSNACKSQNRSFLRFDYFAHGQSGGDFMDFTIGKAVSDTMFMMNEFIDRTAIIIGSSMGGWVGLRLLQMIPEAIHGFIGIAAAPDFTRKIYASLDDGHIAQMDEKGYVEEPSDYDEPYIFTKLLLDEGEHHCLLDHKIDFDGPIHLLQGKQDTSVDWHMTDAINHVLDNKAKITLIDDGDHSLSRPQDLEILKHAIDEMSS